MNKRLAVFIVLICALASIAAYDILYFPMIRGDADGVRFEWTFHLGDPTAKKWILGDTTATGMFVPEQPVEIIDVIIFGDPDSGDSLAVVLYECAAGTGTANVVVRTDTLDGTSWKMMDDVTPSATYKIITPAEGLALDIDYLVATPNSVTVMVIGKYRIKDTLE